MLLRSNGSSHKLRLHRPQPTYRIRPSGNSQRALPKIKHTLSNGNRRTLTLHPHLANPNTLPITPASQRRPHHQIRVKNQPIRISNTKQRHPRLEVLTKAKATRRAKEGSAMIKDIVVNQETTTAEKEE
jgi:hypothetical protein